MSQLSAWRRSKGYGREVQRTRRILVVRLDYSGRGILVLLYIPDTHVKFRAGHLELSPRFIPPHFALHLGHAWAVEAAHPPAGRAAAVVP